MVADSRRVSSASADLRLQNGCMRKCDVKKGSHGEEEAVKHVWNLLKRVKWNIPSNQSHRFGLRCGQIKLWSKPVPFQFFSFGARGTQMHSVETANGKCVQNEVPSTLLWMGQTAVEPDQHTLSFWHCHNAVLVRCTQHITTHHNTTNVKRQRTSIIYSKQCQVNL